jgi:hypothetical protein
MELAIDIKFYLCSFFIQRLLVQQNNLLNWVGGALS